MAPRFWLYKNNARDGGPSGFSGDWEPDVFLPGKTIEWGGHYSTRSAEVAKYLNEDLRVGDVIVAYQTDDKAIIGFCRVDRIEGPVDDKKLWLEPLHHLDTPLLIHSAKMGTALEHSVAVNGPVMLRELPAYEMNLILKLAVAPSALMRGSA